MRENSYCQEEWYKLFITVRDDKAGNTELIQGYEGVLHYPDLSDWERLGLYSDLALLYLESGEVENGLKTLEKAIALGYNDFIVLQEADAYKQMADREEFRELYSEMRISQADARELYWMYAEIQTILYDTNMMIVENMNRADNDYTQIPQVKIPTRPPQSLTILSFRHKLQMWQRYQKEMVLNSDINRINHNTNMVIIKNISSIETGYTDYTREIISREQAQRQLEARAKAVCQREFVLPPNVSITPEPCPDL